MLSAIAGINQAIERGNATELLNCLKNKAAKLEHVDDDSVNRYLEQLVAVKKEKGQVFFLLNFSFAVSASSFAVSSFAPLNSLIYFFSLSLFPFFILF